MNDVYVDAACINNTRDGKSWSTAYKTLQESIGGPIYITTFQSIKIKLKAIYHVILGREVGYNLLAKNGDVFVSYGKTAYIAKCQFMVDQSTLEDITVTIRKNEDGKVEFK